MVGLLNLDIWSQVNILGCESVVLFVLTRVSSLALSKNAASASLNIS